MCRCISSENGTFALQIGHFTMLSHHPMVNWISRGKKGLLDFWCARGDLNSHPLRDQILSLARLPFRHARDWKTLTLPGSRPQGWIALATRPCCRCSVFSDL